MAKSLFDKTYIGKMKLKNRIFMSPMGTTGEADGAYCNEGIDYFEERAKGGAGLIITGANVVSTKYEPRPCTELSDFHHVERLNMLIERCHAYGAKVCVQLSPGLGRQQFTDPFTPPYSAGSVGAFWFPDLICKPFSKEDIHYLVEKVGYSASLAVNAGADCVELHAYGGYLLDQFHSVQWNNRTDEYGGDIHGRLRLTLEVIEEVRKQCGRDFIIDVRISGDEYSDGGLTLNDMIYVSKQLEKATVDFIHVSGGNTIKKGSSMPASGTAPAPHKHASEEIKKHVSIPVATVSRINEPWVADELIANGVCDACMIGRPNLCDSEFANKAKAGKIDEIRPCIGCGRCLTGIMFGKPISCTVNPAVEKEEIDEAPVKKKVLVVGGGPAGMEAAYVAKKRGHEVVLCEQSDRLGGQLNIACVPIGKQEITKVVKYMKSQLTGVDVRLNTTVTKEMIENEFKDYEVITTVGATPKEIEPYKVFKQTMTADDILSGKKFPGRKIVIIGGGSVGCETADYLAPLINDLFPTNRDITLIEMTKGLMTGESGATKSLLTRRMMEKGVKIELNSKITYVDENTIKYEKNHQEYVLDDVDTLVFAVGYNPVASPIENAHLIGDCQKVGTLKDAITNAYQITKEI